MNAMIFAAGLGTRLKPLTDTMPKAMVPVCGKPLVQILLERLVMNGCREAVINVHHFADQIINYVRENDSFGIDVKFSDERDMLLETGGGLKKALPLFSDDNPVVVHNVDILSNVNLSSLYADSLSVIGRDESVGAVMLVSERKTQRYLLFDDDDTLVGWTNIQTGQVKSPYESLDVNKYRKYAFAGIQVCNPKVLLPMMNEWDGKFSIIDFYLSICDKVKIKCSPKSDLRLLDVGKLDTITLAEEFVKE